ncbi:hypothetical protein OK074_6454 [Actinobacteria bacterium OK074]|nr:hypothetical protein OK074_6454 [Actinobacteria bacterium OK074]
MGSPLLTLRALGAFGALGAGGVLAAVAPPPPPGAPAPGARPVDTGTAVLLTPSAPAPGTDVRLAVHGCAGRTGTAHSDAFVADARLVGTAGALGVLGGESRVRSTLEPGSYDVTVVCDGSNAQVKGVIAVSGPGGASASPTAVASPIAPVAAGGGEAAERLAALDARVARDADGPGLRHAVTGLVLAALAAGAIAVRGARRGRGTD